MFTILNQLARNLARWVLDLTENQVLDLAENQMFDILNHPLNGFARNPFENNARRFREFIADPVLELQIDALCPKTFRTFGGEGKISLNFCGSGLATSLGGVGSPKRIALLGLAPPGGGTYLMTDTVRTALLTKEKLDKDDIHAEHPVPCSVLSEIGTTNGYTGYQLWSKLGIIGFCTAKENNLLSEKGLARKMPLGWDGITKTARWDAVGLQY